MHVSMVRLYRPEIYRLKAEEGRRCCGVETGLIALFCCVDDSAKAQIIARELRSPDLPRQHVLRLVDKHRKIADENQRRQIAVLFGVSIEADKSGILLDNLLRHEHVRFLMKGLKSSSAS